MTYDYECLKCLHTFQAEQKITDAPLAKCPRRDERRRSGCCDGTLKRLISSSTTFALKGKGWFKDGY